MTSSSDPSYRSDVLPTNWTVRDSENLGKIATAQGVISALLGLLVVLSVATLVLGIIGYMKTSDRLDNIEHYTEQTATRVVTPAPAP